MKNIPHVRKDTPQKIYSNRKASRVINDDRISKIAIIADHFSMLFNGTAVNRRFLE